MYSVFLRLYHVKLLANHAWFIVAVPTAFAQAFDRPPGFLWGPHLILYMNPTNAENLATINMNVLISHLTHDIYNHALFDFTCHRCYFQVLLYVPQPSQTVLAWFYLKHSWHISFLIKVNCVHVLTSEGLHVREIMSEKSCQRDHVRSWQRNHVRGIMSEGSCQRDHDRGIICQRNHVRDWSYLHYQSASYWTH